MRVRVRRIGLANSPTRRRGWYPSNPFCFQTIDVDANSIAFRFPFQTGLGGTSSAFDGLVVTGFSHDIESVAVASNTTGWLVTLGGNNREITINLNGLSVPQSGLILNVDFAAPVPEPSSGGLMAAGLLAVGALVRRRS